MDDQTRENKHGTRLTNGGCSNKWVSHSDLRTCGHRDTLIKPDPTEIYIQFVTER